MNPNFDPTSPIDWLIIALFVTLLVTLAVGAFIYVRAWREQPILPYERDRRPHEPRSHVRILDDHDR